MPKLLLYITKKGTWIFLVYDTDANENRCHVHVGQRNTKNYCKIWLEPEVELAYRGDLSASEIKEVLALAKQYRESLIKQWKDFLKGKVKMIKIKN